jgi:hypothetical protein
MALTCPKCEKLNLCDCKSCNPNKEGYGVVIFIREEEMYQCFWCGEKFNECDSLDFEWDRMTKEFARRATPEICYEWITGYTIDDEVGRKRKEIEEVIGVGEYGFSHAIGIHFNIRYRDVTNDDLQRIKKQLKRDKKLNQLL